MMQQHETARSIPHSNILTLDILPKKSLRAQMSSLPDHVLIILKAAPACTIPSQPGQQWDQHYTDLCHKAGNILRILH